MEEQNWERVKEVFYAALERPAPERQSFLDEACSGNAQFRSQVEILLDSYHSGFLEDNVWPDVIGDAQPLLSDGSEIGQYRIIRLIGQGGMGEVYEALDTKLDRRVALKFLSRSLRDEASARRRLKKEAQAVAMLDHPNICSIFSIEELDDEIFIVMQFIDGVSLEQTLRTTEIDTDRFFTIAKQITAAVAFAHDHGIIHRDLKPANIMLTPDGTVKVLDFGLAKIIEQKSIGPNVLDSIQLSTEGLIAGTIAYMSPEQLRGEPLDYRSDIFSLGVIFYELVTKANPFQRKTKAETISAILSERVSGDTTIPFATRKVVDRCLEKKLDDRYSTVQDVDRELNGNYGSPLQAVLAKLQLHKTAAILTFFGFIFVAAFAGFYAGVPSIFSQQRTVAILPIIYENPPIDRKYLAEDLTRTIVQKLSGVTALRIRDGSDNSQMKANNVDPLTAGAALGAEMVLSGSIELRNGEPILKTNLIQVADGTIRYSTEQHVDQAVRLPEAIVAGVIENAGISVNDTERARISKPDTESEEAKSLYLLGQYYSRSTSEGNQIDKAIEAYTKAKDLDQNYAKAWAGLAVAYLFQSSPGAKSAIPPARAAELARAAAQKAISLDNNLADAYYALAQIYIRYEWNWVEAERNDRIAISLNPDFMPARYGLINVLRLQGRYDEAMEEIERIRAFDPVTSATAQQVAMITYKKRDFERSAEIVADALAANPTNVRLKYMMAYRLVALGWPAAAVPLIEPLYNSPKEEEKVTNSTPLGIAYAKMGNETAARNIIADLDELGKRNYVPSQEKGIIYAALGDRDNAFEYLTRSCRERFSTFPDLMNDPVIDGIRDDPRYLELRRCANL